MSYLTYRFRTKDPIIDRLRTLIQIEASLKHVKFGEMLGRIAEDSGVKRATLNNWFYGKTRYPRFASVAAVVCCVVGPVTFDKAWNGIITRTRPQLRLVGGPRA